MSGAVTLYESACTAAEGSTVGQRWTIEQLGTGPVPEFVVGWVVFLTSSPVGIGRIQWADLERGVPSSRLYWGTLRDGGACPGTTLIGYSLEECADRMVRRWLGVSLPEVAA